MNEFDRRDFLKASGVAGVGLMGMSKAWSLTAFEPLNDTLSKEYPYRGWEDVYRDEYEHDVAGYASHCVNCHGNCLFKILVKDGIVIREEQLAKYPQINPNVPDGK